MYPESSWPTKPADIRGEYSCRAAGGKSVEYETCTNINTSSARNRICQGCICPWRICYGCTIERTPGATIRAIDPATGLCPEHAESYKDQVPKGPVPIRPFERPSRISLRVVETTINLKSSLDPEEIARIAGLLGTLSGARAQVVPLFAAGMNRAEVSERLGIDVNAVGSRLHQIRHFLNIDVDSLPGLMAENIAKVLAAAYRLNNPIPE